MTKVTIYMAISSDGFIAGSEGETPWSDAEWEHYKTHIQQADCLIIGRTTYELMKEADQFAPIGSPKTIIVGTNAAATEPDFWAAKSPEAALALAKEKNWQKIIVGGGTILNSYFLNNKLAVRLHLDIEPVILGAGLKLFETDGKPFFMEYEKSETLPSGTISVDYNINYETKE